MSDATVSELQRILGQAQTPVSLPHPRAEYWRWSGLETAVRQSLKDVGDATKARPLEFSGLSPVGDVEDAMLPATSQYALYALARAATPPQTRAAFKVTSEDAETLTISVPAGTGVTGSHVTIDVAPGASVTVLEGWQPGQGTSVHLREFRLGKGAQLTRIVVLPESAEQARVLPAFVETGEDAKFRQYVFEPGGIQSRVETHVQTAGEGGDIRLNHAYLLRGPQKADQTSQVVLDHEHTKVRQLVKGVVTDQAEAVFQGKFLVNRPAQHADAKMGHHCLLLSEQGRVRAKPELEIYADDVECAHGNTTGMLDADALFYMRQRGLPEAEARALLMRAFISEAFDRLPESQRDMVDAKVAEWMEAVQ